MTSVGFYGVLREGPHRTLLRRSLEGAFADIPNVTRALDLGCGVGPYSDLTGAKASFVVKFDRRPPSAARSVRGSAERLPFGDGAFDLVLTTQVLEHVPEPASVVAEAARVLTPGGWLVVSVPQMVALHEEPHDYFRYTRYGITHLLESNGFHEIVVQSVGGFWSMVAQQLEFYLLWDRGFRWRPLRRLELLLGRAVLGSVMALDKWRRDERYALNLVVTARRTQVRPD